MKNRKSKISYEPEADVLSWEISKRTIDHAKEMGNFVIHFNKQNNPVLVEILEASKFLAQARKAVTPAQNNLKKTLALAN